MLSPPRPLVLSLVLFCGLAIAASARAEPGGWLVLPTTTEAAPSTALEQAAAQLTAALAAQAPAAVGRGEARRRFEERHSTQPVLLSASDIQRWTDRSRSALRNLARADYEAARRDLSEAQELTAGAIEELNRETEQARKVLDTCLYLVRAMFEAGQRSQALAQVRQCRARSPKASPSPGKHPPETLELMAEVDQELARQPPGRLFIDSIPRACTVRLNGFDYGPTPRVITGLMQGDYRVQVECADSDRRGRVYRVAVSEAETQVVVDAAFDTAVLSQPSLALRYGSAEDENSLRLRHARAVARVLEAAHVVLITPLEAGTLRADRLDIDEQGAEVVASVLLPFGEELALTRAQEAARALLAETSLDQRGEVATSIEPWQPPDTTTPAPSAAPSATVAKPARALRIVGFALAGAGAVGAGAAFVLYRQHREAGDDFRETTPDDPHYLHRLSDWQDGRGWPYAAMVPSVALATTGAALAMGRSPRHAGLGWASGAVGVGLLAWGLTDIALGSACRTGGRRGPCVDEQAQRDRGGLVAAAALPFLYVPVHQLLLGREVEPAKVVVGLNVRSRLELTVRGQF